MLRLSGKRVTKPPGGERKKNRRPELPSQRLTIDDCESDREKQRKLTGFTWRTCDSETEKVEGCFQQMIPE